MERSLQGSPNIGSDQTPKSPALSENANLASAHSTTESLGQSLQSLLHNKLEITSLRLQAKSRPNYLFPDRPETGFTSSPFEEDEELGYRPIREMEPGYSRTGKPFNRSPVDRPYVGHWAL